MRTVLIVDDEPQICRALKAYFTAHGFDAKTASNVADAFAQADTCEQLDVAIVDWMLHDSADGMEVLEQLRERWPQLVAILISGLPSDSVSRAAAKLPNAQLVSKPFSPSELLAKAQDMTNS